MEDLNWLAIITGTVAGFLFGWAVYSPRLFGKGWAEGSGVTLGGGADMPVLAMAMQFLALLLLALVVGLTAQTNALWTAILAILAAAAFVVSSGAFVKKSTYALCVDGGYVIGAGVLMIIAQGVF